MVLRTRGTIVSAKSSCATSVVRAQLCKVYLWTSCDSTTEAMDFSSHLAELAVCRSHASSMCRHALNMLRVVRCFMAWASVQHKPFTAALFSGAAGAGSSFCHIADSSDEVRSLRAQKTLLIARRTGYAKMNNETKDLYGPEALSPTSARGWHAIVCFHEVSIGFDVFIFVSLCFFVVPPAFR